MAAAASQDSNSVVLTRPYASLLSALQTPCSRRDLARVLGKNKEWVHYYINKGIDDCLVEDCTPNLRANKQYRLSTRGENAIRRCDENPRNVGRPRKMEQTGEIGCEGLNITAPVLGKFRHGVPARLKPVQGLQHIQQYRGVYEVQCKRRVHAIAATYHDSEHNPSITFQPPKVRVQSMNVGELYAQVYAPIFARAGIVRPYGLGVGRVAGQFRRMDRD